MLNPDFIAIKPQTGTCYCHMDHPHENHSKNLSEINPSAEDGVQSMKMMGGEGESRKRRISSPASRAAVAARGVPLDGPSRGQAHQ